MMNSGRNDGGLCDEAATAFSRLAPPLWRPYEHSDASLCSTWDCFERFQSSWITELGECKGDDRLWHFLFTLQDRRCALSPSFAFRTEKKECTICEYCSLTVDWFHHCLRITMLLLTSFWNHPKMADWMLFPTELEKCAISECRVHGFTSPRNLQFGQFVIVSFVGSRPVTSLNTWHQNETKEVSAVSWEILPFCWSFGWIYAGRYRRGKRKCDASLCQRRTAQ
jgi:hypothetical protein